MAELKLSVAQVELRTCKLSKAILKQFPVINDWESLRQRVSGNIRSPFEDQQLKRIEAKYSTDSTLPGATDEELARAKELAGKKSFSSYLQEYVVGWVHGSVFGDEHDRYLLLQVEPGQYVLYRNPHFETVAKFKQVFVI